MSGKHGCWLMAVVLLVGLLMPAAAKAGPYLGEWGWCWNPAPDCPRGMYSPWHYWNPVHYRIRGWVHPSYQDQYPPGPSPTPPIFTEVQPSRCRTQPPAPSPPYADPAAYYGRPIGQAPAPP